MLYVGKMHHEEKTAGVLKSGLGWDARLITGIIEIRNERGKGYRVLKTFFTTPFRARPQRSGANKGVRSTLSLPPLQLAAQHLKELLMGRADQVNPARGEIADNPVLAMKRQANLPIHGQKYRLSFTF